MIPFKHVPLMTLVYTSLVPSPTRDQLSVKRAAARFAGLASRRKGRSPAKGERRMQYCRPSPAARHAQHDRYVDGGRLRPRRRSHPARGDVAVNLSLEADEDDAVSRGVSLVPLHLVIGYGDSCPVRDLPLAVRDDRNVAAAVDLEDVGFVSVGLATTRYSGIVGLLQPLKPPSHVGRRAFPLAIISRRCIGSKMSENHQRSGGGDAHNHVSMKSHGAPPAKERMHLIGC